MVYFKNGGVLRGEIIGKSAKTGKIQLRDGSIFVYKKSDVKMTSKELLQASEQSAREDSLKIVGITLKVLAEEAEKRRADEEQKALRQMLDAHRDIHHSMPPDDRRRARLYSVIDAGVGVGFGQILSPKGQGVRRNIANTHKLVAARYAVGGRGDYFGMGVSFGVQQLRKSVSLASLADSSGSIRYEVDSTPSSLLFLPVGLDMRLELLPASSASPFISAGTTYAVSLNSGKDKNTDGFFILNPAIGLRFGGAVSSLLSVGSQVHIEPNDVKLHFITLRFGVIF